MNRINDLDEMVVDREHRHLMDAAECLSDFLSVHGRSSRPFQVLRFLADETLKRLAEGKESHINNVAIQEAVHGKVSDPSKWLSPIWGEITKTVLPERQEGLIKFARDRGMSCYPSVVKLESGGGAGNQTLYRLEARALPPAEPGINTERVSIGAESPLIISYIPELCPKPAWGARWLFEREFSFSGWRKGVFFAIPLVWLLAILVLGLLAWFLLSVDRTPVSPHHLMMMLGVAAVTYYGFRVLKGFEQFLDDRIVLAPVYFVALKENGICIERFRPPNSATDAPQSVRLVRYAAQCPICRAQVLLEAGEPDFPRRLVGRCQESPREHVFSFDRVTQQGINLRGAELI